MYASRCFGGGLPGMACLAMLLAGCATRTPQPEALVDWPARDARLLLLDRWDLRGRIAVKADSGGGQGDLQWRQQGEATDIRVSGPFGAGAYAIRWDAQSLSVSSRDGEYVRSWSGRDAAEQFLAEQLGWSFPAVSSRYWLRGLPDPASPAKGTYAARGELVSLEQSGWTVTYGRYVEVANLLMPARIEMQNPRARLRLVIDRWNF